MRLRGVAFLFALAFALAAALTSASAQGVVGQTPYYPRQTYFQIAGTCETDLSPDKAAIVGGVSSSGLKPTDAADQLDKELALMRTYVAEKHGQIQMMERARTLKNPQPGRADTEPPFEVVQRFEATFPADAPVDAILQKLVELGMDRFGDNVLNNSNRREAVARFRISNFDGRIDDFQRGCVAEAWKQWCGTDQAKDACPGPAVPSNVEVQSFNVRSKQTLMRPDGGSAPWQLSVNRGQHSPDPPDLLGNVPVHLEGNIALTYHTEEKP